MAEEQVRDTDIFANLKEEDINSKKVARFTLFVCLIAAVSGLMFGFDTGVISGALAFIQNDFQVPNDSLTLGFIVGSTPAGACIGALCGGMISSRLGRRRSLKVSALFFIVGALVCTLAPGVAVMILGKLILGLAIGIASFVTPLYLSAVAPENIRGSMISLYQLMITIGIAVSYVSDLGFAQIPSWRGMFGVTVVPAIILLIGVHFVPGSPKWLIAKGKDHEAIEVLKKVRTSVDKIRTEVSNIKDTLKVKHDGFGLFRANANFRKVVFLGIVLQLVQQLTGINIVMYFCPKIMEMAGFGSHNAQMWATIVIGITNVLSTFIAIALVDRWGRRPILITGFAIMAAAMLTIAACISLHTDNGGALAYVTVGAVMIFIVGFAASAGPLIWVLCSEIQPLKGRDFGITCSTASNWISNAIITTVFPIVLGAIGNTATFVMLGVFNFAFIFFTMMYVPETKGISLEGIEKNLMEGKKLRNLGNAS